MRRRILPPRYLLPLLLVLAVTIAVFVIAGRSIDRQRAQDRRELATQATALVRERIAAAETIALRHRVLLRVVARGDGDEFARFARSPLARPAIRSIAWIERVPASRRVAWEHAHGSIVSEFGRDHAVVPAGRRSEYYPGTYVASTKTRHSTRGLRRLLSAGPPRDDAACRAYRPPARDAARAHDDRPDDADLLHAGLCRRDAGAHARRADARPARVHRRGHRRQRARSARPPRRCPTIRRCASTTARPPCS